MESRSKREDKLCKKKAPSSGKRPDNEAKNLNPKKGGKKRGRVVASFREGGRKKGILETA